MILILFVWALLIEAIGVYFALLTLVPRISDRFNEVKIEDSPNLAFFGFFANYPANEYVKYVCRKLRNNEAARKFLATEELFLKGRLRVVRSLPDQVIYFGIQFNVTERDNLDSEGGSGSYRQSPLLKDYAATDG